MSPIRRAVPQEVQGIVATLNQLFGRVERSITAHQAFISDAAHQLRNPAAAVLSMAEATRDATSDSERKHRAKDVVDAARATSRITEQLLSLDRLRQEGLEIKKEAFDLGELTEEGVKAYQPETKQNAVRIRAEDKHGKLHDAAFFMTIAVRGALSPMRNAAGNTPSCAMRAYTLGAAIKLPVSDVNRATTMMIRTAIASPTPLRAWAAFAATCSMLSG